MISKLQEFRESAGLTQQELANSARVARASVSHVESGRCKASIKFAGKVCGALSLALGQRVCTWHLWPEMFTEQRTLAVQRPLALKSAAYPRDVVNMAANRLYLDLMKVEGAREAIEEGTHRVVVALELIPKDMTDE